MRSSTIAMLFAATVLGAPSDAVSDLSLSSMADPAMVDQGDGFYLAILDEAGVPDVQFTPMNELDATATVDISDTASTSKLLKRGTVCSGRTSINVGVLDKANVALANNANAKGNFAAGAWGWVHDGGETSFFCNYQANYLTYNLIIDMQTVVSGKCGRTGYGNDRRINGGGASDLSVGRTFRGDHFCDQYSHGR